MLKVAIDSGPLKSGHSIRGVGTYVSELLKEISKYKKNDLSVEAVDFSQGFTKAGFDILHFTFFNPYFINFPKTKKSKWIVSIHDLIPLLYKDKYAPGVKGNLRFLANRQFLKKADGVISISETTKKDIVRLLGISESKIEVIYEASKVVFKKYLSKETEPTRKKYNLPEKFILYVGDVNYNKNLTTLVVASKIAKVPLVICGKQSLDIDNSVLGLSSLNGPKDYVRYLFGKPHPEQAHYEELLSKIKNNGLVTRLGYVSDLELKHIYNLASVYVQPSFYEGFGLSVLEAMSVGVPTVISKTQALVEVSNGSSLIADPKDPSDFAEKINNILKSENLRKKLIEKGLNRSKEFSWRKTANDTLKYYYKIGSI